MSNPAYQKPYIIGVTGGSGSGKTFFLKSFLKHFAEDEISLISQDDYYIPAHTKTPEENRAYNFDLPESFQREKFHRDLLSLIKGEKIFQEEYTYNNPALTAKIVEINPAPILIVEGLFIFHFEEINALLDHRIFIHADEDVALKRRIKRDFIERGYSEEDVRYKWNHHVSPAFAEFLLPYKTQCNQIIENNADDPENIHRLTQDISAYLRQFYFYR